MGKALAARGVETVLATGNQLPPTLDTAGLTVVDLPLARSPDASFSTLLDAGDRPIDDAWRQNRLASTLYSFTRTAPDILLTETFPFGRKPFRFELLALLDAARAAPTRPVIAASIRDILVRKASPDKERAMAEIARDRYDLVLVHSDPAFVRLEDSFPFTGMIEPLIRYTGYVHSPSTVEPPAGDGEDEVIVSCGGGPVGLALLRTALEARPLSKAAGSRVWRVLVNQSHGRETFDRLAGMAREGFVVEATRPDFPGLLERCALSISQAGYNTVLDILAASCRSVLVPFAERGETEQTQRAMALQARGRAGLVAEDGLTPEALAKAVDAEMARSPDHHAVLAEGAERSAEILIEKAEAR